MLLQYSWEAENVPDMKVGKTTVFDKELYIRRVFNIYISLDRGEKADLNNIKKVKLIFNIKITLTATLMRN